MLGKDHSSGIGYGAEKMGHSTTTTFVRALGCSFKVKSVVWSPPRHSAWGFGLIERIIFVRESNCVKIKTYVVSKKFLELCCALLIAFLAALQFGTGHPSIKNFRLPGDTNLGKASLTKAENRSPLRRPMYCSARTIPPA